MTDHDIRLFETPAAVVRVGEGLLSCDLPKAEWTHEAHLAATTYLLVKHSEIDLDLALPGLIRSYNESVGGVNDDRQGYHHTITRAYLHGIRLFLLETVTDRPFNDLVNDLLRTPMGRRDWPLHFWSKKRLMSVEARREWVSPDLQEMPVIETAKT